MREVRPIEDLTTSGRNVSKLRSRREVRPLEDVNTSGRNVSELRFPRVRDIRAACHMLRLTRVQGNRQALCGRIVSFSGAFSELRRRREVMTDDQTTRRQWGATMVWCIDQRQRVTQRIAMAAMWRHNYNRQTTTDDTTKYGTSDAHVTEVHRQPL